MTASNASPSAPSTSGALTTFSAEQIQVIRCDLLAWFDATGRDLPWRAGLEGQRDPYRVWVAEILLQQTQVSRGLLYYERFLSAFPTVQALAQAPLDDVLKAWEGCGYYARARNLHKGAKQVTQQGLPRTYHGWLNIPGIGPYTAAAIASLANGEARAVNDGNVRRVLARLHANQHPTDPWVQQQADTLLDPQRPGAWNEGLMDLGATTCTPKTPNCPACPLNRHCAALASGQPTAFPAPKTRTPVRAVHAVALLIGDSHQAVLEKREGNLLGGLMGLPTEEFNPDNENPENPTDSLQAALNRLCQRLNATPGQHMGEITHTMTHRHITLHLYTATAPQSTQSRQPTNLAALSRLDQKALQLAQRHQESLFGTKEEV